MKVDVNQFDSGWFGISMALSTHDIDRLVGLLNDLRQAKITHFHAHSTLLEGAEPSVAEMEIYLASDDEPGNAAFG